jgi:hypothetical protein
MARMNRSELVANQTMGCRGCAYDRSETTARQQAYEAEARATLAKLRAQQAPGSSLFALFYGAVMLTGCALYGVGYVMGVW